MITVAFSDDQEQSFDDARKARAWLRRKGLTVKNAEKVTEEGSENQTWVFDVPMPAAPAEAEED